MMAMLMQFLVRRLLLLLSLDDVCDSHKAWDNAYEEQ